MIKNLSDKSIVEYYRVEYFREWQNALKNGINLTPNDIRFRLGLN